MLTPSTVLGARLGDYEIQDVLGSGGMATVYRGFDHTLQRPVAIKVLSEAAAAQPGLVERFRQEARLIARLRHPHIVQVYAFGQVDQVVYMVQELLPGPTLATRLQELAAQGQPMPRQEILAVIGQLAAALDAAHAAGIIHRDVKPSNALWNAAGELALTDFGIAKSGAADGMQTQTGVVFGTPVYVSPEQARGEPLTPASDIYALGVVLYELIAGRPPFDGPVPLDVVLKHLQEPPPPLAPLRPDVPPEVEAVVRRALAKSPAERFATAGELARALEAAWPERQPQNGAQPDVHSLPTTVWQASRPSGAAQGEAAAGAGTQPVPASAQPQPAAPAPPASSPGERSKLLPLLAALLVLLLLGGAALALSNDAGRGQAADTADAAVSGGPFERLRELLADDPALLARIEGAERALAAGDRDAAAAELTALQRQILAARQAGAISAETMRAALSGVTAAAAQHGIPLALEVSP